MVVMDFKRILKQFSLNENNILCFYNRQIVNVKLCKYLTNIIFSIFYYQYLLF